MHVLIWPLLNLLYGFTVRGIQNVPLSGGVVLAANHASYLDPPVVACATVHRSLFFMARDDLFRYPLVGWLIHKAHALPIRRGSLNRKTLNDFRSLTKDSGAALLVFPEGTRSPDGALGPPRRGVGAICRAAHVPVVPVLLQGTYSIWPRWRRLPKLYGKIEVRFGPPVQWTDEELNATGDPSGALATLIMKRIAQLQTTHETPLSFWKGYKLIFRPLRSCPL